MIVGGTTAWIAGCSVTIGGGASASFTVGNKTVTMRLGLAGVFDLIQGIPIILIADASGFFEMTFDNCVNDNGDPKAFGVHCDEFPCSYACCSDDGDCTDMRPDTCTASNGTPGTPGFECSAVECEGACCKPDGTCQDGLTADDCTGQGGADDARGSTCADITCPTIAPTKCVLIETRVNPANNDSESPNSITLQHREVEGGFQNFNITVASDFPTPPSELIPGENVVLSVSFTGSGTVVVGSPGAQFQYWVDGSSI